MELKYYDKPWLPAFKGAFLILFGIIAMLRILGTIKSLAVLFVVLIAMTGILLIAIGVRYDKSGTRIWNIISGVINLGFCIFLGLNVDKARDLMEARQGVITVILIWILFNALTEVVEAVILYSRKNAFAAIFLINALLSLLFGYLLNAATMAFTEQSVIYIGTIALVFGVVNVLSSWILSVVRKTN